MRLIVIFSAHQSNRNISSSNSPGISKPKVHASESPSTSAAKDEIAFLTRNLREEIRECSHIATSSAIEQPQSTQFVDYHCPKKPVFRLHLMEIMHICPSTRAKYVQKGAYMRWSMIESVAFLPPSIISKTHIWSHHQDQAWMRHARASRETKREKEAPLQNGHNTQAQNPKNQAAKTRRPHGPLNPPRPIPKKRKQKKHSPQHKSYPPQ